MSTRMGLILLAACVWTVAAPADVPLMVGDLGDVRQIAFSGNEAYSAEAIRHGLAYQLEYLPAARELAPLSKFLEVLSELIERGYLARGYADVVVETAYDEQAERIAVTIYEGPRYREGEVQITGVEGELHQLLLDAVLIGVPRDGFGFFFVDDTVTHLDPMSGWTDSSGRPEKPKPLWGERDHPQVNASWLRFAQRRLTETLERKGYIDPVLSVRLTPTTNETVDLQVDIESVGRLVQITDVTIEGAQTNSEEAIRELVGFQAGDQWTTMLRTVAQDRLRACGRFLHAKVSLVADPDDPSQGSVQIQLRECEKVPPLGEPLTEADALLLKCAHWLETLPHDDFDIVIDWHHERAQGTDRVKLVTSSTDGAILNVSVAGPSDEPIHYAFLSDREHRSLLSLSGQRRYEIADVDLHKLVFQFAIRGLPDVGSHPRTSTLLLHAELHPQDRPFSPVEFSVDPAVFLHYARRDGVVHERSNGVATWKHEHVNARIDEETGRFLSMELDLEEMGRLRITTEPSACKNLRAELQQAAASFPNVADPDRPITSFVEFVVTESAAVATALGHEELAAQIGAWRQLLWDRLAPRLENLAARWQSPDKKFLIPAPEGRSGSSMLWLTSRFLQVNDELLDHDARPARLGRELTTALLLRNEPALRRAASLAVSKSAGPLTSWYAAELARWVSPRMAAGFARCGLWHIERRHFRHDVEELLKGDRLIGNTLREVAAALRELPPEQLQQLLPVGAEARHQTALTEALHPTTDSEPQPEGSTTSSLTLTADGGRRTEKSNVFEIPSSLEGPLFDRSRAGDDLRKQALKNSSPSAQRDVSDRREPAPNTLLPLAARSADDQVVDICEAIWAAWAEEALGRHLRHLAELPAP